MGMEKGVSMNFLEEVSFGSLSKVNFCFWRKASPASKRPDILVTTAFKKEEGFKKANPIGHQRLDFRRHL